MFVNLQRTILFNLNFMLLIVLVKSRVTNEVLVQGVVGQDCLYAFPTLWLQPYPLAKSCFSTNAVINTDNNNSIQSILHAILGHFNAHVMKLMFQPYSIPFPNNVVSFLCRVILAKFTELLISYCLQVSTWTYPSPIGYLLMAFHIMQLLLTLFPNLPRFILRKSLISLLFFINSSLWMNFNSASFKKHSNWLGWQVQTLA